ncbi:MAG: hypothetical protein OS112_08715 [Methanoregula sp.]|nr:MAG: hypothetical protein OS112_08715 [Methanoregula sp.]
MQLPRGKFRSIKKEVPLGEILNEMATSGFSGICSFSSNTVNGTMVFKGGAIILAKVQEQYGDPAIDEARSIVDQVIDAVLSDLDGTQMQLALDFNKHAYVRKGGWQGAIQKPEPESRTVPKEKNFMKTLPVAPPGAPVPAKPGKNLTTGNSSDAQKQIREEQGTSQEPPLTSAEKEFETFDSMDIEDVTQKIRRDSKVILKQLELDHLMEK